MDARSDRIRTLVTLNSRRRQFERVYPRLQSALRAGLLQTRFTPPEESIPLLGAFADSYDSMEDDESLHYHRQWPAQDTHSMVSFLQDFKSRCQDMRVILILEWSDLGTISVRFHSVINAAAELAEIEGNGFSLFEPSTASGLTLFKEKHFYSRSKQEDYWTLMIWGSKWLSTSREVGGLTGR